MKDAFLPIAEPRLLELVENPSGIHLEQRLAHRPVSAQALVHADRVEIRLVDVREQDAGLVHSSPSSSSRSSTSWVKGSISSPA
jgi:hypothetical protein